MRYPCRVGTGLQHSSGRVIGLGRLLLAILYFIAVWADAGGPARAPLTTYWLLGAYVALAALTVALTWKDWALDARLAGPAHALDITFFTLLVLTAEGSNSPYFTFFMFVLLAAAIRWGWRSTALTSVLLILLYLIGGMLVSRATPAVELEGFALRTGHLVILSLILIWFGASRWRHGPSGQRLPVRTSLDQPPVDAGLDASLAGLKARSGAFLWRQPGQSDFAGLFVRGGERTELVVPAAGLERTAGSSPFLYDVRRDRTLRKDSERNLIESRLDPVLESRAAADLGLRRGLAVPVRAGDSEGAMFLEGVRGLSTDHIDLGEQLAKDLSAHMQAHALLRAADESAEARSRLMLARDLHDGVVQFLAGAAFRLEAMRRAQSSGRDLAPDLDELKNLILQEQHELRSFISVLRAGGAAEFAGLAADLRGLADRLARQWAIRCTFEAEASAAADRTVPARLQMDVHQLVREAVANAVRHAEATSVRVSLAVDGEMLRLDVVNNGLAPHLPAGRIQTPRSLQERVEQAGGVLDISRGQNLTRVSMALPIAGGAR